MAIFMATVGILITVLLTAVGIVALVMGLNEPNKRDRLMPLMIGAWVTLVGVVGAGGFMILFQKALSLM